MKNIFEKITITRPKEVYDFSKSVKKWLFSNRFEERADVYTPGDSFCYSHEILPLRIYVTENGNYRLSIVDFINRKNEMNETLEQFALMKKLILHALELAEEFINFLEGDKQ